MNKDLTYQVLVKQLARYHFEIKAIIQDIIQCRDSMDVLNNLNEVGRNRLAAYREEIENLEIYAQETSDEKALLEVETQRHQLSSVLKAFKKANMSSLLAIETSQREDLLRPSEKDETGIRNRKKTDKDSLLKTSSSVTDQLLSISRQLADTTQRSQDTLDNLVTSSSTVHGTQNELENTAGSIQQSGKLLKKYGRREFTDKLVILFAFLFFISVVLYIINKRLF